MPRHARVLAAASLLAPAIAVVIPAAVPAEAQDSGSLVVTVTGLHSAKGQLIACLWRDKDGFPSCEKSKTAMRRTIRVSGPSMEISFPGVAPGQYAVTVLHDEDGNGRMKHNLIGMPAEGVGVSNNPGGMPGYGKSLVTVGGASAITVRIRYLFG